MQPVGRQIGQSVIRIECSDLNFNLHGRINQIADDHGRPPADVLEIEADQIK